MEATAKSKPLDNPNPKIYVPSEEVPSRQDYDRPLDAIDALEIFDLIREIRDPEHPYTLEQLNVVSLDKCEVELEDSVVRVWFAPTVELCSMATLIGLSIKVKLIRSLPENFKIDVLVSPGTHSTEEAVNKQLADKERVAAALENQYLIDVVNQCLETTRPPRPWNKGA